MRHPDFWQLPGGRRYVQSVLLNAMERSVFVQEPLDAGMLVSAIATAIRADGLDTCLRIDEDEDPGICLVDRLRALAGSHATSVEGFALYLGYTVLLSRSNDPISSLSGDLRKFATAAARRTDDAAPRVVVVSDAGADSWAAPTWSVMRSRGVLDHLDGASFAAQGVRARGTMVARLAVAVAVEVGAWDLTVIERIQALPEAIAIRPDLHLAKWSDERIAAWAGVSPEWHTGSFDELGGEPYVHALFLAANNTQHLARRVWRAHVGVLFPWLEEVRQEVVRRYRDRLLVDVESYSNDIESLDWGPICRQLSALSNEVLKFLHDCRRLRNDLAHGRPAGWADIERCWLAYGGWRRISE